MSSLRSAALLGLLLAGCGSAETSPSSTSTPREPPIPDPPREAVEPSDARCLPIVAAECGCVYRCAEGTLVQRGTYSVTDPFWTEPLTARVDRWCVGDECTDAFFAEIVCSGICAPRPADPTCAFREGRCQSGRPEARVQGAYRVSFAPDTSPDGTLSLTADGRYHYAGASPPPSLATRFHFTAHPEGAFAMELAESGAPDVLGVVRFDPDDEAFDPADPSRSFQVRRTDRGALELHGIVSELQTWRVERRED